jgi:hypothetical protein
MCVLMKTNRLHTPGLFVIIFTIFTCSVDAEEGVRVTCGHELSIADTTSVSKDWAGRSVEWSAIPEGDTLVITRRKMCGDECSRLDEIRLGPFTSSDCPTVVSVRQVRFEYGSPVPSEEEVVFSEGKVLLQDWSRDGGVVSGRFEGKVTWDFYARFPSP